MSLGKLFYWARMKEGFTSQESLAMQCHVSKRTISDIENDKGNPGIQVLQRVADACKVELKISVDGEIAHRQQNEYERRLAYLLEEDDAWSQGIIANIIAMERTARQERKKKKDPGGASRALRKPAKKVIALGK